MCRNARVAWPDFCCHLAATQKHATTHSALLGPDRWVRCMHSDAYSIRIRSNQILAASQAAQQETGIPDVTPFFKFKFDFNSIIFGNAGRKWLPTGDETTHPPPIATVITAQSGDTAFLPCHVPLKEEHGVSSKYRSIL